MAENQDSPPLAGVHRTTIGAATLRAFHLFKDGKPKILCDEFALPLSGLSEEEIVARLAEFPHTSAGWVLRSPGAACVRQPDDRSPLDRKATQGSLGEATCAPGTLR